MPTLFDQLLGSWELVSYQLGLDTRGVVHPLGEDAVGLIVYTPQRRMSVNIMRPGRATWASPNPAAGTESEIAAAAAGYLAYGGSFTVDETLSVVEHHVCATTSVTRGGERGFDHRRKRKHGVSDEDIRHTYAHPIRVFELDEGLTVIIGANRAAIIHEIGVVDGVLARLSSCTRETNS